MVSHSDTIYIEVKRIRLVVPSGGILTLEVSRQRPLSPSVVTNERPQTGIVSKTMSCLGRGVFSCITNPPVVTKKSMTVRSLYD